MENDIKPSQVPRVHGLGLLSTNGLPEQKEMSVIGGVKLEARQRDQHTVEKGSNCYRMAVTPQIWRRHLEGQSGKVKQLLSLRNPLAGWVKDSITRLRLSHILNHDPPGIKTAGWVMGYKEETIYEVSLAEAIYLKIFP